MSYLWWFVGACSWSCSWRLDWIRKGYPADGDRGQNSGTLLSCNPIAHYIFLNASLLPAAMGSSSLGLNHMSSGFRSHDEKFMESWTHYKFYSFTTEILLVLLTYWRKENMFYFIGIPKHFFEYIHFPYRMCMLLPAMCFTLPWRAGKLWQKETTWSCCQYKRKKKATCNWKHDKVYGSLISLSLWLRIPYMSQWLYPSLF